MQCSVIFTLENNTSTANYISGIVLLLVKSLVTLSRKLAGLKIPIYKDMDITVDVREIVYFLFLFRFDFLVAKHVGA